MKQINALDNVTQKLQFHVVGQNTNKYLRELVTEVGNESAYLIARNEAEFEDSVCRKLTDIMNINSSVIPTQPVASFTASPTMSRVGSGVTVTFNNTSTGNDNDLYSWSFGDGSFSTEKNPSHTYTQDGQYSPTLSVHTVAFGDEGEKQYSDLVTRENYFYFADAVPPPVVNFTADVTSGDIPPDGSGFTVNFSNQITGQYTNVSWNFGDGATSSQLNPSHTYRKEGNYTVSLKAWNTTPLIGGGSDTLSKANYISTWDCQFPEITVNISYTLLEKCPFSLDLMLGVIPLELVYTFEWSDCEVPSICETQLVPQGLKPIAVLDLKYTGITGGGKYETPYKIGENLFWSSSGFLSYEIVKTIDGDGIRLCFNSKMAFPGPVNTKIIISPNANNFTFNKTNNVLGVRGPDHIIRLIEFDVYDKSRMVNNNTTLPSFGGGTIYTATEVCDIINNVFRKDIIALPDKYGRVVLISTGEPIRVVGLDQGSTANRVFGWDEYGCVGTPKGTSGDISYEVTLYVAAVMDDTNMNQDVMNTIQKLVGPYRAVIGEFEIKSTNYFELVYGDYPREIINNIYLPPGHRYIAQSVVSLKTIEESTTRPTLATSKYANTGYVDIVNCPDSSTTSDLTSWTPDKAKAASLASPYWEGMVCDSNYYDRGNFLWLKGDDFRFYTKRVINAAKNCIELRGNYDFLAPGPVIKNEITAKKVGPYTLPLDPSKKRFLSIRRISVAGTAQTFTGTEGNDNSISVDWATYNHSTQLLSLDAYKLPNLVTPTSAAIIQVTPDIQWSNGDTVQIVGTWSGVGSSELTCTINPYGHSGDTFSVFAWVDFDDKDTTQTEDWIYVELPFGDNISATEIIKAMQRDGDWLRTNNSNCHWTPSTSRLNANQYLEVLTTQGQGKVLVQLGYKFENIGGRLRIRTSTDYDYRIRLGGTPEACYANSTFGWNSLGELGDRATIPIGPYYTYTYGIEAYATKDLHPSMGSNDIVAAHIAKEFRYKLTYTADKQIFYDENGGVAREQYEWVECGGHLVKSAFDRGLYLNILLWILQSYYECDLTDYPNLPPVGDDPGDWEEGTVYQAGDEVVGSDDNPYVAIKPHTATGFEPWEEGKDYPIGDEVVGSDENPYVAIKPHTSTSNNSPTSPLNDPNDPGYDPITATWGPLSSTDTGTINNSPTSPLNDPNDPGYDISKATWSPLVNTGKEYPFTILSCDNCITFTSLTVPVSCNYTGNCDSLDSYNSIYFDSLEARELVTEWNNDPFLSLILDVINDCLLDYSDYQANINKINNLFDTILDDSIEITDYSESSTEYTEFSISTILTQLTTLRDSIIINSYLDPLKMIKDMATFTVTYVETFNASGAVNGVDYIRKKFSTLDTTFDQFTLATYSLFTKAVNVLKANLDEKVCTTTIDLTCDVDVFQTVYPLLLDLQTGQEIIPSRIKLDLCYCSYDNGDKNQLTVCVDSTRKNAVVGVMKAVTVPEVFLERLETFELSDSTGQHYTHTISWDADAMPMGIVGEPDSTGEGDPSVIKSVEWSPRDETMTIELCPAALEQYKVVSSGCSNCIVLPGVLTYTFTSSAIPSGSVSVEITGTQIMIEDFIDILEENLQNLDIEVDELGIITIDSISDSVQVSAPAGDPFGFTNVLVSSRDEIDILIYYTYLEKEEAKENKSVYVSG